VLLVGAALLAGVLAARCARGKPSEQPRVVLLGALKVLPNGQYPSGVLRVGFTTPGDSPVVLYAPTGAACTIPGGDNSSQIQGNDGKCWNVARPTGRLDVRELGAKCDGVTDDTAAIHAAVATPYPALLPTGKLCDSLGGVGVNKQLFAASLVYDTNVIRNGQLAVWQRGITNLPTSISQPLYTADGWQTLPFGSPAACYRDFGLRRELGGGGGLYSLQCVGAAGNTGLLNFQRIESYDAAHLAGQMVTLEFSYLQTSGGTATPQVTTCYPSSQDTFGGTAGSTCAFSTYTTEDLAPTNLVPCANNVVCTEAVSFKVNANAINGYQVDIDCRTPLPTSSNKCWISDIDLRTTPGVVAGINTLPHVQQFPSVAEEITRAQRYVWSSYGNNVTPCQAGVGVGAVYRSLDAAQNYATINVSFPQQMRTTPSTIQLCSPGTGNFNKIYVSNTSTDVTATVQNSGTSGVTAQVNNVAVPQSYNIGVQVFASSEL
jgi:hypothetical protein